MFWRSLIWSLIGLPLVAIIMIAGGFYAIVRKLADSRVEAYVPDDITRDARIARTGEANEWAERNGFRFLGYYVESCMNSLIAAWQHASQPTLFCAYVVNANNQLRITYDFVTLFERDVALTTGTTKDGQMMPPRPGAYVQTFSDVSLDEQWRRHTEAERFLTARGHVRPLMQLPPFVAVITAAIHRQVAHVRSLPLWPFRAVGWFASRRTRWHNLSIEEQHEKAWISLPNELGARL